MVFKKPRLQFVFCLHENKKRAFSNFSLKNKIEKLPSWRIIVDGRSNSRNKADFSNVSSVVWKLPEKIDSKNSPLTRINPTVKSKHTAHVRSWRESSTVSMRWVACWIYIINRMLEMLLSVNWDLSKFNWKFVKHGAESLWRVSWPRLSNAASVLPRNIISHHTILFLNICKWCLKIEKV